MKKVVVMMAMLLAVTAGYAQKKAVSTARNRAMNTEAPDFKGAREAIAPAFENEETKNDANTYFVAGLIGYQEIQNMIQQVYLGKKFDEKLAGECALEAYNYWMKADELSQVLVADKKGNMKPAAPKVRQQIAPKMLDIFRENYLIAYGNNFFTEHDYKGAYDNFMRHLSIPKMEMMQDPKIQKTMVVDTTYYYYKRFAGQFAYELQDYEAAQTIFNQLLGVDSNVALRVDQIVAKEFLAEIAKAQGDTAAYERHLEEGFLRFPDEPWFVQSLINHYLNIADAALGQQKAMEYVNRAIEQDAQRQYFVLRGQLCVQTNQFDAAKKEFEALMASDPTDEVAVEWLGRAYFFEAVKMNEDALNINDNAEYQAALKKMDEVYKASIPFFEKAHELKPESTDVMRILKQLYYRFQDEAGMAAKLEAISNELGY